MAVLVTGGAGYIGSVTVELLRQRSEQVVVVDDLARGHAAALDGSVPLYRGSVGDRSLIEKVLDEHDVQECIHFAALAYVAESVREPTRYFHNNVVQGLTLVETLLDRGVKRLVFSSSCATYGEPERLPIAEGQHQRPTNPYGWSKLMLETVLQACDTARGLRFVALRYFNAAGATERHGEHHDPETHLIPLVLQVAAGRLPYVSVLGADYPTADGSAVRDYIHVADLASAHLLALHHLRAGTVSAYVNLGTGHGSSVLEVIEMARRITGAEIPYRVHPRREGDPAQLVALPDRAHRLLGWRPQLSSLESIVSSAWQWHQRNPRGYG